MNCRAAPRRTPRGRGGGREKGLRTFRIHHGDCLDVLRTMAGASVDAVVTDPPYELGFMGRKWDSTGIAYSVELWAEVLRVLKPGAHLLAFGGTRTYHRMACAIEDAGFEIRDQIQWLYGSGFPKSLDVSKAIDKAAGAERSVIGTAVYGNGHVQNSKESIGYQGSNPETDSRTVTAPATPEAVRWGGWGTALKPACEPIVVARKPLSESSVAANVMKHGTGALNINDCRIAIEGDIDPKRKSYKTPASGNVGSGGVYEGGYSADRIVAQVPHPDSPRHDARGRWPANVIMDEAAGAMLDEHSGPLASGKAGPAPKDTSVTSPGWGHIGANGHGHLYGDTGGASRFFYCPKADTAERNAGLYDLPKKATQEYGSIRTDRAAGYEKASAHHNNHPTVKPLDLMQYLVRLVTPQGGLVLDPFTGSGSTGIAVLREGFRFVGIEREAEYVEIARRRIAGDAPLLNTEEAA